MREFGLGRFLEFFLAFRGGGLEAEDFFVAFGGEEGDEGLGTTWIYGHRNCIIRQNYPWE